MGNNTASGGDANGDTIINFENITGSAFNDTLDGDDNDNIVRGGNGNDTLRGHLGVDNLYGEEGDDILLAFVDNDIAGEVFDGGSGSDTLKILSNNTDGIYDLTDDNLIGIEKLEIFTNSFFADTFGIIINQSQFNSLSSVVVNNVESAHPYLTIFMQEPVLNLSNISYTGSDIQRLSTVVVGTENQEYIYGSFLNNTIRGMGGDDEIRGGEKGDYLDGGLGIDTVIFNLLSSGVSVDLAVSAVQNTGGAGLDIVIGFENILGSAFDDTLSGDDGDNRIQGADGDDVLDGRAGKDTAVYSFASAGVTVNLNNSSAQDTIGAGIDTLSGFEDIAGSLHDDTLTGDSSSNIIMGSFGVDILAGGNGGVDNLYGDSGNDVFKVNSLDSADLFAGDVFSGGTGTDKLQAIAAGGGTLDFRVSGVFGIETLEFQTFEFFFNGSNTAQFNAHQFITSGFDNVEITLRDQPGGTFHLDLFMDSELSIDLSAVGFSGFVDVDDGVNIVGDSDAETITGSSVSNNIQGNGGNDVIEGGDKNDILDGGTGSDNVSYAGASAGVNVDLAITASQNTLGSGFDTLTNFEVLTGSAFNDDLSGSTTDNEVFGGDGHDRLRGGAGGRDFLHGEDGDDTLEVSSAIVGDLANGELFDGGAGVDTLLAKASGFGVLDFRSSNLTNLEILEYRSSFSISVGSNIVQMNASQFSNSGISSVDVAARNFFGGTFQLDLYMQGALALDLSTTSFSGFNDFDKVNITGGSGFETITGASIRNNIQGKAGNDIITGGAGNDILDGGSGSDTIFGGDGDDMIEAGSGFNNTLFGNKGRDTLLGGAGDDDLFGNRGIDFLDPGLGQDDLDGGGDFDRVSYAGSSAGVTVNLDTGIGSGGDAAGDTFIRLERVTGSQFDDTITGNEFGNSLKGNDGADTIFGLSGRDVIEGRNGDDILHGGDKNDNILGGNDNDQLFGDAGFDKLFGGLGNDELTGGTETDHFVFNSSLGAFGGDVIMDFENGVDRIDVRNVFSIANPANTADNFSDFTVSASAGFGVKVKFEGGQVIYLDDAATGIAVADIDASDFIFA